MATPKQNRSSLGTDFPKLENQPTFSFHIFLPFKSESHRSLDRVGSTATSTTILTEGLRTSRFNVATSQQCRNINLNTQNIKVQCHDIGSAVSQHQVSNVTTSSEMIRTAKTMLRHQRNVATSDPSIQVETLKRYF